MPYDLAVVGLGYVGLPLAVAAAGAGLRVLGLDVDVARVASIAAGRSHTVDVADVDVAAALRAGFTPTTDGTRLAASDVISISVPTPLRDGQPDLAMVRAAARTVGDALVAGQLVILESTTYPGTTEDVLVPLLEEASGLKAGADFWVAFSPERIDPGNEEWPLTRIPKVVGGIDAESTARAVTFYESIFERVVPVAGTREAETAKLLENTYRQVNIALVNEMAIFCRELNIDIHEAIRAAATKPFGFQEFRPGPGVGGHCIPVDPSYLSYSVRRLGYPFRFVELANEINQRMPRYVVDRATTILNDAGKPLRGARILLLGAAYKAGVSDARESPSFYVARLLAGRGAELTYADPHVPEFEVDGVELERVADPVAAAAAADLVIVLTPHREFDLAAVTAAAPLVLDTRGVAPRDLAEQL